MISPTRAVGSRTLSIERHWGHPSASAASLRDPGTMEMTSCEARVTIGSIMTDRDNDGSESGLASLLLRH